MSMQHWVDALPTTAPSVRVSTWSPERGSLDERQWAAAVGMASAGLSVVATLERTAGGYALDQRITVLECALLQDGVPYALMGCWPLPAAMSHDARVVVETWPAGCAGIGTSSNWWVISSAAAPIDLSQARALRRCEAPRAVVADISKDQHAQLIGLDPVLIRTISARAVSSFPPSGLVEFAVCQLVSCYARLAGVVLTSEGPADGVTYCPLEQRVFIQRGRPSRSRSAIVAIAMQPSQTPVQRWPPIAASQFNGDEAGQHHQLQELFSAVAAEVAMAVEGCAVEGEELESREALAERYLEHRMLLFGDERDAKHGIAKGELKPKRAGSARFQRPCVTVNAAMVLIGAEGRLLVQSRGNARLALPSTLLVPSISDDCDDTATQLIRAIRPWVAGTRSGELLYKLRGQLARRSLQIEFTYAPPGAGGFGRARSGVAITYACDICVISLEDAFDFGPVVAPGPLSDDAPQSGRSVQHLLAPHVKDDRVFLLPVDGMAQSVDDTRVGELLSRCADVRPCPSFATDETVTYDASSYMTVAPLTLLHNLESTGREMLEPGVRQALHAAMPPGAVSPSAAYEAAQGAAIQSVEKGHEE